uniref:Uncharacterized protein n=1 Tax=Setaria viridis TaxID=4556 RepID=A0A4U6TKP2_SETVI|nr:hypothetical protein SEVIR_7G001605v2 [Setaria viridis]
MYSFGAIVRFALLSSFGAITCFLPSSQNTRAVSSCAVRNRFPA